MSRMVTGGRWMVKGGRWMVKGGWWRVDGDWWKVDGERRKVFCILLAWIVSLCCNTVAAQVDSTATAQVDSTATAQTDSTAFHCPSEQFKPLKLAVPASLIAAGTFGVHNGWFRQVKNDVREEFADLRGCHYIHADDYIRFLPAAANIGLGLFGVKGRHPLKERFVTTATATAIMVALGKGMKHAIREKRPDSEERNSFPSGHTATAFMGAELVRCEYGTACGIAAYGVAATTAFLRLYNDRHWLNDVIGGAGIGVLSAQAAYWLLPLERKWLGWGNSPSTSLTLLPVWDGQHIGLAMSFAL